MNTTFAYEAMNAQRRHRYEATAKRRRLVGALRHRTSDRSDHRHAA